MKWGSLKFVLFLTTAFLAQTAAASKKSLVDNDCKKFDQNLEAQISLHQSQLKSLLSLMGAGEDYLLPLSDLFEVDLNSPQQIKKRVQEIANLIKPESVLETPEIKKLKKCSGQKYAKDNLEVLARSIAQLNKQKIVFLEMNKKDRDSYIASYGEKRSKSKSSHFIDDQLNKTIQERNLIQKKLDEMPSDNNIEEQTTIGLITKSRTELTGYALNVANEQIAFLEQIKEKRESLSGLRKELTKIKRRENVPAEKLFRTSNKVWEQAVDSVIDLYSGISIQLHTDLPRRLQDLENLSSEDKESFQKYLEAHFEAKKKRSDLINQRSEIIKELKESSFKILRDSGSLRAKYIGLCDQQDNCKDHRELNAQNVADLNREIKVIPVKLNTGWVAKTLEIEGKIKNGLDGWLDLSGQALSLFFLLLSPILLFKSLTLITKASDKLRHEILQHSPLDYRRRTAIASWLIRIRPFITDTGMLLLILLAEEVIGDTVLKEVSLFLFYIRAYFIYRIARTTIQIALEILFSSKTIEKSQETKTLAESSSRKISRLILFEVITLKTVAFSTDKALLYGIFGSIFFYINVLYILLESKKWQEKIYDIIEENFPHISPILPALEKFKFISYLTTPLLLLLISVNEVLTFSYSKLIRFDIFKRLNSEIFKRRLENDNQKEKIKETPPDEYLKYFDYYLSTTSELIVHRDHSIEHQLLKRIDSWKNGAHLYDCALIVGNRGIGKSTVLQLIAQSALTDFATSRATPKILTETQLFSWLGEVFEIEIKSPHDILLYDQGLDDKKVIMIDDIQNLFLGTIGGFKAYQMFIEIISLPTKNIFWCLTISTQSWLYLKGIFGAEHFYGEIFDIKAWSDLEIQRLILNRHNASGFDRTFDSSIKAFSADENTFGQQSETQFFRLLWGQSRGNPRSALSYWVSAITDVSGKQIGIGVPQFIDSSVVSGMSDNALFLLAAIARHDSLSFEEMHRIVNIEKTVILKCLKEALDKNLIWSSADERFRISSKSQYTIDYFLTGKNFIYE